jgi:hypothetical protein
VSEGRDLTYRRWHQELELLLIQMGVHGARQDQIVKHFKGSAQSDEIVGYLEMLVKEDKAQKFEYGRYPYWRATVNILNNDYRKEPE